LFLYTILFLALLCQVLAQESTSIVQPRPSILVLAEDSGHHIQYSRAATLWLNKLAADSSLSIDYIQNTEKLDETMLKRYDLFIQLDYPPYGWSEKAAVAFQRYIEAGKGGWIGFHHATLLGEFDGYPMWKWFSDFMGGIRYQNYISTFVSARVVSEDMKHPVVSGVPANFTIDHEEWYTYNKSPRQNVHILASVDEDSYRPNSLIKMGDHPVIWTNPNYTARNVYIFMGHSPDLFNNHVYTMIFRNAIFWALNNKK
jgi:type 1 glutamine amidotransferase